MCTNDYTSHTQCGCRTEHEIKECATVKVKRSESWFAGRFTGRCKLITRKRHDLNGRCDDCRKAAARRSSQAAAKARPEPGELGIRHEGGSWGRKDRILGSFVIFEL